MDQYFQDYKYQKVINRILPEFEAEVDEQAEKREYNLILQPRASVIEGLNRDDAQLYFMDAMGAEYLGYIISVCRDLDLISNIKVCMSELPSITSLNKEFLNLFGLYVNGKYYAATDLGNNHYRVDMPDLKRPNTYYADVHSGSNVIAEKLPFVIKKEGQKERELL